jgi:hypothetical protein
MTNDQTGQRELAERLLAEEARGRGATPGHRQAGDADIGALLEHELATERRLRRAAIGAWSAVLAIVPLLGVAFFIVRTGGGAFVEVTRAAAVVVGILGILALFLAVLTTVTWLLRPRTASLAAIERRLAALERLLTERRHA